MQLSVYDYIVCALVLIISAAIGLYFRFTGGKQKTVQEYMLANGQMSSIPVAFSVMASFMSAITLLGVPSENYMYGTQFMLTNVSHMLGTPIVAYVYLPVFFELRLTSVYEYLELRFGRIARLAASLAFSLQMFLYMGIVLYAPALALSAVTGLNKVLAVLSIGFVCTFYSTIGGMKAVLLTDVFQSFLMFAAVFCVIINGSIDMGGLSNIFAIAEEGGRIEFFNFDMDPTIRHTVWSTVFAAMIAFLSINGVNQAQIQRLLTVRTLKESQRSLFLALPISMLLSISAGLAGLTIYAKYRGGPLLGLFTLGMFFPFVSQTAVVPSFLTAVVFGLVIGFGGPKPPVHRLSGETNFCDPLPSSELQCTPSFGNSTATSSHENYFYFYRISYLYYTLIGFVITIVLASVLSLWFPQKERVPKNLLSPLVHKLMGYGYEETCKDTNPQLDQEGISANTETEISSKYEFEIKS